LLNEDRDFGAFLKRMRKLFVQAMKWSQGPAW
jgi:hypothetical protein